MIENSKKAIIREGFIILDVTKNDIDIYLSEVKESIRNNRYRIEQNPRRQDKANLFLDYIIDESMAKDILLGLTATDFSEVRHNEHRGFEHELLYIFGKDVKLVERFGNSDKLVSLYIKFNKLENCYVIVVSLHEQKYPLKYYFK